jgi:hypothetical protein
MQIRNLRQPLLIIEKSLSKSNFVSSNFRFLFCSQKVDRKEVVKLVRKRSSFTEKDDRIHFFWKDQNRDSERSTIETRYKTKSRNDEEIHFMR